MQQNQPNSQTPPNPQSVPDHRFDEVMEKMRLLEMQNQQLRGQIDMMAKTGQQQGQPGQTQQNSPFKPEVQQAITELVNQRLEQERTGFRQQIGMLYDQLDAVNFSAKYSGDKFAKYHDKVDRLRQQYQSQNQYITREDALRMVYFEETGKKDVAPQPQAQTPPPQQQPVYDPYFQTWVDPQTGRPIAGPQATPAPEEGEADPNQQQQPGQQQWQRPPPPAQQQQWAPPTQAQAPQAQPTGHFVPGHRTPPGANHPHGNAYGQTFQLPNQGLNQQAAPTHQAQGGARSPLSLESSEADLAAFENQFGDIPL